MSLACEIQPTGQFGIDSLRFKQIDFYNVDGERIGWLCLGGPKGDVLFIDGLEVSITQLGDPPQLRLATRDPNGLQMGGVVQGCALRQGEDVHENLAQLQIGGKQEDTPPGTLQGSIVAKVRTNQGPDEDGQQTALALTAAYEGKLWGGLPNFPGSLGKYANATDGPQYVCPGHGGTPAPSPADDTLWSLDGLAFTQQQSDNNGNFVTYVTSVPFSKDPSHAAATFDTNSTKARLDEQAALLDEIDRRLDKLERRHRP